LLDLVGEHFLQVIRSVTGKVDLVKVRFQRYAVRIRVEQFVLPEIKYPEFALLVPGIRLLIKKGGSPG